MENLQMPLFAAQAKPTQKEKKKYIQDWAAYNLAQSREKELFQKLLYALVQGIEQPEQKRGRPRHLLADIIFCTAFKVYSTVSARRFMSDLRWAQAHGYIERTPQHSTLFGYFENPQLTPILHELIRQSSLPLRAIEKTFAVDSSGFRVNGYVKWFNARYGKEQENHDWLKLHLVCGVKTHIVIAAETSERHDHDSPFFDPLVTQAAKSGFKLRSVVADKAYSSRANLELVVGKGGMPYIDFKDNAKGESDSETWNKIFHYYSFNRAVFDAHYHQRSNIETVFHMIKMKFGERIRSKTETAKINEALCKVLCHNICVLVQSIFEFGLEPVFWKEEEPHQMRFPF